MNTRIAVAVFVALLTHSAAACSIVGFRFFEPNPNSFEPKYDEKDESPVLMPAPVAKILSVQRGTTAAGDACTDFGLLDVELEWPTGSGYTLDEVGFYFRVASGAEGDPIFPDRPVIGTLERNRLLFTWLDGHPSTQQTLRLRVEVFAVNAGLQIGPSTYFDLKVSPGEHRGPRRTVRDTVARHIGQRAAAEQRR